MQLKDGILNALTAVAACCAIVVAVMFFRGKSFGSPARGEAPARPISSADWTQLISTGHRIGPSDAAVTLVEFGDFECPACGAFAPVVDSVRKRYPNNFAVVFHHFPLSYHHLAYPLARASECAAAQGRFAEFYDSAYAKQSDMGIISVAQLGAVAGVPDTVRFNRCFSDTARVLTIDSDIATAKRLGVAGTPGLALGDSLLSAETGLPSAAEIERRIAGRIGAH